MTWTNCSLPRPHSSGLHILVPDPQDPGQEDGVAAGDAAGRLHVGGLQRLLNHYGGRVQLAGEGRGRARQLLCRQVHVQQRNIIASGHLFLHEYALHGIPCME